MKVAFFNTVPYLDVAEKGMSVNPPVPSGWFDEEVGMRSLRCGLELFDLAEELGFDWVTLAEHHYSPRQMTPNPLLLASAISQRLSRVRIAILGSLVPMNNPIRLAEEYAMLDMLTEGRLVVGLLRGTAPEYVTYGTNPLESRERYEEGVELMLRAWSEPMPFGWEGRYYQYRTVSIWPRPIQKPTPPVYLSANSFESGALAARLHLKAGLSFTPLPTARQLVQHYKTEAANAGWQPGVDDVLLRGLIHVACTDEQADANLQRYVGGSRPRPTLRPEVNQMIKSAGIETQLGRAEDRFHPTADFCGSPETVAAQLRAFREQVGVGTVDLLFQAGRLPGELVRESIELFGKEVLPRIHDL